MRNTQNSHSNELRAPAAPEPPIVSGNILSGPRLTFIEFLNDAACQEYCERLFGSAGTSAAIMLREFGKGTEFHYYGVRPGKLTADKATTKRLLKEFARQAYDGDPDHRGVMFWERVAWLIWQAYDDLMALRARAERIKQQEIARIDSMPVKRARKAAYMRARRAKLRANPKRIKDGTRRDKSPKRTKKGALSTES